MPESPRNDSLTTLYLRHWPSLRELLLRDERLSAPYLACVHPDYEEVAKRLVVVGKETNGWEDGQRVAAAPTEEAVRTLMHTYRDFRLGLDYRGKLSFWTPVHELYQRMNPGGPPLGFVALNASMMDRDSSTPGDEVRDALIRTRLLQEQIRILDPHVVVFHTGPAYEKWLDGWFPGLKRDGDRWLARLEADGLPRHSFRTYHPQYLNHRSRRVAIYDRIIELVAR